MRLFVGVWVELPQALLDWREEASRLAPAARWAPLASTHVTLQFLGEVPAPQAYAIAAALAAVRHAAVPFRLRGLGFFPHPRRAQVAWAGVEPNPALAALAAAVQSTLRPLGFAPESRPFQPHVTLARARHPGDLQALLDTPARERVWGEVPGDAFRLVQSQTGSRYTQLRSYALP